MALPVWFPSRAFLSLCWGGSNTPWPLWVHAHWPWHWFLQSQPCTEWWSSQTQTWAQKGAAGPRLGLEANTRYWQGSRRGLWSDSRQSRTLSLVCYHSTCTVSPKRSGRKEDWQRGCGTPWQNPTSHPQPATWKRMPVEDASRFLVLHANVTPASLFIAACPWNQFVPHIIAGWSFLFDRNNLHFIFVKRWAQLQ